VVVVVVVVVIELSVSMPVFTLKTRPIDDLLNILCQARRKAVLTQSLVVAVAELAVVSAVCSSKIFRISVSDCLKKTRP